MNKKELIEKLYIEKDSLINFINSIDEKSFTYKPSIEKWSCAEQAVHLITSTGSSILPYKLPGFLVKLLFVTYKQNIKSYDELVALYNSKLNNGAKASGKYANTDKAKSYDKKSITSKLDNTYKNFIQAVEKCEDAKLDRCQVPHPLLGKISLRDLIYFTIYHTAHHTENMKEMLRLK